ncbi:hypothetical protein HK102_005532 [Quaeritorhiza haematococci]|nr:hypothetical protein HK102_005532 [Quaeritorhiza haematococci]
MATKNIEKGETIIEVPKKLLITIDRVDEDLGGALGRYPRGLTEHQALSYWLGWQRNNPDSAERPYLDMLPDNFDTCAAMLPKDLQVHLPVELQGLDHERLYLMQLHAKL